MITCFCVPIGYSILLCIALITTDHSQFRINHCNECTTVKKKFKKIKTRTLAFSGMNQIRPDDANDIGLKATAFPMNSPEQTRVHVKNRDPLRSRATNI